MIVNKKNFLRVYTPYMIKKISRSEIKINDNLYLIKMEVLPKFTKTMIKHVLSQLDLEIIKINTSLKTKHIKTTIWPTNSKIKIAMIYLKHSMNNVLNQWQKDIE